MDLWPQMLIGARWSVGNGSRVRFWMDYWIMESPLIDIAIVPVLDANREVGSWVSWNCLFGVTDLAFVMKVRCFGL